MSPLRLGVVSIPLWCDLKPLAVAARPTARAGFHPTMVRFKGVGLKPRRSKMVSVSIPLWCDLKVVLEIGGAGLKDVSIPLWCDLKALETRGSYRDLRGFHPTMVRFKADSCSGCDLCRLCFHPTMVRFKGHCRRLSYRRYRSFHPTMVRFKVIIFARISGRDLVSIPLWCDLKRDGNVVTDRVIDVSIPLWCDLKL